MPPQPGRNPAPRAPEGPSLFWEAGGPPGMSALDRAFNALAKQADELRVRRAAEGRLAGERLGGMVGGFVGPGAALGRVAGGAVGQIAGEVGGVAGGFMAAASAIKDFVKAARPGTIERFNIAVQDTQAVIGQRLAPVFEDLLIPAVRLFGDFLHSILPDADQFRELLKPAGELLGDLRDVLAPLAPVVKDVLVTGLKLLGEAIRLLLIPVRALLDFLGVQLGHAAPLKSSVGAAARSIKFQDPLAAAHEVYAAAFRMGAGGGKQETPLDKIGTKIDTANSYLDKIFGADSVIGQLLKGIGDTVKDIIELIPKPIKDIAQGAADTVEDFWNKAQTGWGMIGDAIADKLYPGNKFQPATARGRLSDVVARKYGAARRYAAAKGKAGADVTKDQAFLDMLKELRDLLKQMGASAKAQQDIEDELRDFARKASGRGIDGHGGGGR